MYLIGLTGNIGSGKSTVLKMLEQLGARTIDADSLAHSVILKGTPAWRTVAETFGPGILTPDGEVDRKKLGAVVFADRVQLEKLEAIVHPAVSAELARLLIPATEPVVVVEAIKLIEAGLHRYCDAIWIVTAPVSEARRRLVDDRGMADLDVKLRLRAQPPLDDKLKMANLVIDNGGSVEATRRQVKHGYAAIRTETASDKRELLSGLVTTASASAPRSQGEGEV
jgi:dephospho-CoA kinase